MSMLIIHTWTSKLTLGECCAKKVQFGSFHIALCNEYNSTSFVAIFDIFVMKVDFMV